MASFGQNLESACKAYAYRTEVKKKVKEELLFEYHKRPLSQPTVQKFMTDEEIRHAHEAYLKYLGNY